MTRVYFAYSAAGNEVKCTYELWDWERRPLPMLVSFFYIQHWNRSGRFLCKPSHTILDSGAFSAWNSGKDIDMAALVRESMDPYWQESVGLDVVGDAAGTERNLLSMQKAGSPAYPVFHIGEPFEYLERYKENFGKVGLSCRFGEPAAESLRWLEQCFARAWPCKFHSFGWVAPQALFAFPFHTADTASWVSAARWGRWKSYGFLPTSPAKRGQAGSSLMSEIQHYLALSEKLEWKWQSLLKTLDSRPLANKPVALAAS